MVARWALLRSSSHFAHLTRFAVNKTRQELSCIINGRTGTCVSRSSCTILHSGLSSLQDTSTCEEGAPEPAKVTAKSARLGHLCKNRDLSAAKEVLNGLLGDSTVDLTILLNSVNCLLYYAVEYGDHDTVDYVLSKMALHRTQKNNATSYILSQYYATHGMLQRGIKVLREMQATGIPTHARNYHPLVLLAVKQGSIQEAFNLCCEMRATEHEPSHQCYAALINGVTNSENSIVWRQAVFDLLHRFQRDRERMGIDTLNAVQTWFRSQTDVHWQAEWTQISNSGICQSCNKSLQSGELSAEEYSTLKTHLQHQLWYVVSLLPEQTMKCFTPIKNYKDNQSVQNNDNVPDSLQHYIECTGPYDVVVDALNVGYHGKNGMRKFLAHKVQETCSLFLEEGKKVLVVGATPIKFNPPKSKPDIANLVKFLSRRCGLFLLRDCSLKKIKKHKSGIPDDVYMLLAAMHCGRDTLLVSKDMFSDHMNTLPADIHSLFNRWLRCQQVTVSIVNGEKPSYSIYERHQAYDHVIHTTGDCWHLPSTSDDTWLCVRKT